MRMTRLLVLVLLTLALLPSTNRVEGQGIGGLVKKKAAEAVKGKDSKKDKAKTDTKEDGPTTSTFECKVTPDVVSQFLEGLQLENARRANFESMFAGFKSHEQVVACRQQEVMGAQVQKILSQGIGPNSTNAQLEKAMAKNSADVETHLNKNKWVFTPDQAKAIKRRCSELVPEIQATGYKLG